MNGFVASLESLEAVTTEIVRSRLKLSLGFFELTNRGANVRMMLASFLAFLRSLTRTETGFWLRWKSCGEEAGKQHCDCCADNYFHEAPTKVDFAAAIAYSSEWGIAYNREFRCASCTILFVSYSRSNHVHGPFHWHSS